MKKLLPTLVAIVLAASGAASLAHGDDHARKPAMVKKEQKEWGIAGDAKAVKQTINLSMSDAMRFTPDKIEAKQGDSIKLVLKNTGTQMHELVIGTKKELEEHAALMVKFPKMEHSEPYMAHVAPGETGEIIWTFNKPGDFDFACLIAGHFQAGMVGKIKVAAAGKGDGHSSQKH